MGVIKCKELIFRTEGSPQTTTVAVDGEPIGLLSQVTIEVGAEELSVIVCRTQTGSDDVQVHNIEFDK